MLDAVHGFEEAWLLIVCAVVIWIIARRLGRAVQVLSAGYITFAFLGAYAYRPSVDDQTGLNRTIVGYYNQLPRSSVIIFFGAVGGLCCAGGWFVDRALPRIGGVGPSSSAESSIRLSGSWLFLALAALAVDVAGVGTHTLLHARFYLDHSGPTFLVKISTILAPVGLLIAANVSLARRSHGVTKVFAILIIMGYELALFGQATRLFSVTPMVIFMAGLMTGRWSRRQAIIIGGFAALLSIALLGPPLYLRGQAELGLVPAIETLSSHPVALFGGITQPTSNALLGVPLSLYVAHQIPTLSSHSLITSLNPLPGSLTDWSQLSRELRLNIYEPYSAVGELGNHGWFILGLGAFSLGAIFQLCERVAQQLASSPRRAGLRAAVIATAALVLIRSTQYNLRTEARFVYYLLAVTIVTVLVSRREIAPSQTLKRAGGHPRRDLPSTAMQSGIGAAPPVS